MGLSIDPLLQQGNGRRGCTSGHSGNLADHTTPLEVVTNPCFSRLCRQISTAVSVSCSSFARVSASVSPFVCSLSKILSCKSIGSFIESSPGFVGYLYSTVCSAEGHG